MLAKRKALVADDDPNIRELLRTYLIGADFDVDMARDGAEVTERLRAKHAHVLILDINMPRVDGFCVLETLRKMPEGGSIPVLVLTARHEMADVKKAIALGAKDYLTKPFSQSQLLGRVGRLLRKQDIYID